MYKQVPFYANTIDNTHCFQAALKMVMKYFWPKMEFSWKQLERISAKKRGLWTWPLAGLVWLTLNKVEVKNIERFNYHKFARDGEKYLIKLFGPEVGKAQIEHSNIKQEQRLSKIFVKAVETEKRLPTLHDIRILLADDFLVVCNVNARVLDKRSGYTGHFVVVIGYTDKHLILHDPGLPPHKSRKVPYNLFAEAWAYPNKEAKNIMAFRVKKPLPSPHYRKRRNPRNRHNSGSDFVQ